MGIWDTVAAPIIAISTNNDSKGFRFDGVTQMFQAGDVLLPENAEFKPTGESPLKYVDSFVNTTCPQCGGPAKRETDTMDTFMCSSWYFWSWVSVWCCRAAVSGLDAAIVGVAPHSLRAASKDEVRAVAAHLMTNLPQVPLAGVAGWEKAPFARVLRFFARSAWPSSLLLFTAPRPLLPVSRICVGTGAGVGGRRRDAGRRAGDGVRDRRGVHRHGPHPQGR
jgi:hypothetical protein